MDPTTPVSTELDTHYIVYDAYGCQDNYDTLSEAIDRISYLTQNGDIHPGDISLYKATLIPFTIETKITIKGNS